MSETEPTHREVAERWSRFDPEMNGSMAPSPYPSTTVVSMSHDKTDLGIVSAIVGGIGFVIAWFLTVSEWWLPFFMGVGALVIAGIAVALKGWRSKGWLAAGIVLGVLSMLIGIVAKSAFDDAVDQINCVADSNTFEEMGNCDG